MKNSAKNLGQIASIFQFFGLQYFAVQDLFNDENKSKTKMSKSKIINFLSFFIQLAIGLAMIYRFFLFIEETKPKLLSETNNLTKFRAFINCQVFAVLILIKFVNNIMSKVQEKYLKKFYLNCLEVQDKFDLNFNQKINFSKLRNLCILKCLVVMITLLLSLMLSLSKSYNFISKIIDCAVILTYFTVIIKYTFLADLTLEFNKKLENFVKKCVDNSILFENGDCQNENFPLKWKKSPTKIQQLRFIYSIIKENSILVNKISNLSNSLIFIIILLSSTSHGHGVLLGIVEGKFKSSVFVEDLCTTFFSLGMFFYLCNSCQTSENINEKLIFELNRLYSRHVKILNTKDRYLINELIRNVKSDPIEFTLSGFYTINLKLFASVSKKNIEKLTDFN